MSVIYVRIRHRFGARLSEWFVAVVTLLWGLVLLLPANSFSGPSWTIFRSIMSEQAWGSLMVGLGALRLAGLVINGARRDVTPWIRVASASVGFVIWSGISLGFGLSGVISTSLATYPAIAILELFNIHRAAHDAGETYAAARRT